MTWWLIQRAIPRAQFALWSLRNPGRSFREFYANSVARSLNNAKRHSSLGSNLKPDSTKRAQQTFDKLIAQGILPNDTVVDYGCGTLRIGKLFIEFLDADRYVGMDIDERILDAGRSQLPPALFDSKRPSLEVISIDSLSRVAALNPKWVFSQGVLQHVPPLELDEYFKNLFPLIHAGATGLIKARIDSRARRLSTMSWVHELGQLEAAAVRHDMKLDRLQSGGGFMRLRTAGTIDPVSRSEA